MVAKRSGPGVDALRAKLGEDLVDEHIAIIGPRHSGKSFLAEALAARFHDGGRGNTVLIIQQPGKTLTCRELKGQPDHHTIRIYDGLIPEGPYQAALRVITMPLLG
jgi:MoxR-like ATPase